MKVPGHAISLAWFFMTGEAHTHITHTQTYACLYTHTHSHTYCMYMRMHIHTHKYKHRFTHTVKEIHANTHVHKHKHTHTHTLTDTQRVTQSHTLPGASARSMFNKHLWLDLQTWRLLLPGRRDLTCHASLLHSFLPLLLLLSSSSPPAPLPHWHLRRRALRLQLIENTEWPDDSWGDKLLN